MQKKARESIAYLLRCRRRGDEFQRVELQHLSLWRSDRIYPLIDMDGDGEGVKQQRKTPFCPKSLVRLLLLRRHSRRHLDRR